MLYIKGSEINIKNINKNNVFFVFQTSLPFFHKALVWRVNG